MATFLKTDPIMDPNTPTRPKRLNHLHRPQIYVNLEFGVSWSPGHLPNNHGLSYRSRGLRDRAAGVYSRQVPPLNTNYLEQIPVVAVPYSIDQNNQLQLFYPYSTDNQSQTPQQQQQQQPGQQPQQSSPQSFTTPPGATITTVPSLPAADHTTIYAIPATPEQRSRPRHTSNPRRFHPNLESPQEESDESSRPSRESRTPVHSRGRSAPPPINDSPWDVAQAQPAMYHLTQYPSPPAASSSQTTALMVPTRPVPSGDPRLWKDLPEPPTSFRLGEEGMPWDALSWPMGYEPEADPEHARTTTQYPGERRLPANFPTTGPGARNSPRGDMAANMTYMPYSPAANIQITSPEQVTPKLATATARASPGLRDGRDLATLSVAMMTIDNGFENQWWNQGGREAIQVRTAPATPVAGTGGDNPTSAALGYDARPSPEQHGAGAGAYFVSPDSAQQLRYHDFSPATLGWAIASPPQQRSQLSMGRGHQHHMSNTDSVGSESLVSPMTPPTYMRMRRTLSTRSDDAYSSMGRYA